MIITSITKDKKHLDKIILSSGEELFIDTDVCTEKHLSSGDEISGEYLNELIAESEYKRAKSRALWYLDRTDHTEKALYQKLVRAGFDKRACAKIISWCVEFGMIDDRRYAEHFAERCNDNNISKKEAMQKMLLKGIPYDLAKEVLNNLETDEQAQITELIAKKYAYKLTQERGCEKVFAALVRKGFSYSAVREALKKYNDQLEYCED